MRHQASITALLLGAHGFAGCAGDVGAPTPPPSHVAIVSVDLGHEGLIPGTTAQFSATPRDADGNALVGRGVGWSSSANAVATVSTRGLVSAVAPGSAYIRATSEGVTGEASVAVWAPRAPMPTPRVVVGVGAVDGLLYAVGGNTGGTVEAYDPETNSWSIQAPLPSPHFGGSVGVVNGMLYAVGGDAKGTVEAYDPATNDWTAKPPLPTPRTSLGVGVINGLLYAVGGMAGAVSVGTVEAYDPATNRWTVKAAMPSPPLGVQVGVVNGVLYAVGANYDAETGISISAYDPTTDRWTPKRSHRGALAAAMRIGVVKGVMYGVQAYSGSIRVGEGTNSEAGPIGWVEAYDPATDGWSNKGLMRTPRNVPGVGAVNGVLYTIGGIQSLTAVGTVEAYYP